MYFDSEKNTKNEKSPFIELDSFEIDTSILNYKYLDTYLKLQAITILESDDSITIATSNPEQNNLKLIRDYWTLQSKKSISIVATSRQNIFSVLEKHFFKENLHSASNMLYKIHPDLDSKKLLSKYEKIFFFMLAYVGLSLLVYQPLYTLLYVTFILTLGTFLAWIYKFILVIINILFPLRSKKHLNLSDDELPFYTILVPLFHENKMIVHQLIKSLKHFHYPPDKLDIKLLLEQDDEQTISVIQKMELPIQFHVLLVPKGKPLTKPRACNYGLAFSIGEYVTVFDAEDQPDPDQLRKVVDCFKKGEEKLICVQAHLNFYNSRDNILTRLFTIEYTTLFDQILAGIAHLKLFIPLGGTSNHFKTDKLKELGTWDANILTEGADIGIRLYRYGYKCTLINSTTYEEANTKLINWFKQRARWNKGYIKTYLVQMRRPTLLYHQLGFKNFLHFQIFFGGSILSQLANVPLWIAFILTSLISVHAPAYPRFLVALALFNFVSGNILFVMSHFISIMRRKYYYLVPYVPLMIFYWMLMSLAGFYSIYELIVRPSYWYKTEHGISKALKYRIKF